MTNKKINEKMQVWQLSHLFFDDCPLVKKSLKLKCTQNRELIVKKPTTKYDILLW